MTTPRGRWKYDEESDTFVEVPRQESEPKPDETDDERKQREQDERDAHPGTYL